MKLKFYFWKILVYMSPFCGATDSTVFEFLMCRTIPQIHCQCDTCWRLAHQHGSQSHSPRNFSSNALLWRKKLREKIANEFFDIIYKFTQTTHISYKNLVSWIDIKRVQVILCNLRTYIKGRLWTVCCRPHNAFFVKCHSILLWRIANRFIYLSKSNGKLP